MHSAGTAGNARARLCTGRAGYHVRRLIGALTLTTTIVTATAATTAATAITTRPYAAAAAAAAGSRYPDERVREEGIKRALGVIALEQHPEQLTHPLRDSRRCWQCNGVGVQYLRQELVVRGGVERCPAEQRLPFPFTFPFAAVVDADGSGAVVCAGLGWGGVRSRRHQQQQQQQQQCNISSCRSL